MRYFNTAGVCLPAWHYMLPPEPRLPEARRLIDQGHYFVEKLPVAPPEPILPEHVEAAKERLILARASHLDSLVAKLYEERVQRIIEPLIAGELPEVDDSYNDDVSYLRDLGLLALGKGVRIANPIYKEVIVRVLGEWAEDMVIAEPRTFVRDDGTLDFRRLLEEFADFWCQHGEILDRQGNYHEVAPQLVLMGFLHRIVNGGGQVDREYGLGRGRIDLIVRWPYTGADGKPAEQREAMELKVWRRGADPLERGLIQLEEYLDRMHVDYGTLVIFDRRRGVPPPHERTAFGEARTRSGRPVTLLRAWAASGRSGARPAVKRPAGGQSANVDAGDGPAGLIASTPDASDTAPDRDRAPVRSPGGPSWCPPVPPLAGAPGLAVPG